MLLVFIFCCLMSGLLKVEGAYIYSCNNEGMYTKSFDNGSWECVPCTDCPNGFRITQPCRYNSDTICEKCPPETYVGDSGKNCQPCSNCQPGYYVNKNCDAQGDRRCGACPRGYYSNSWNSVTCRRCRRCQYREKVIRPCNGRNNSICGGCDKDYYREASTWNCIRCSKCEGEDFVRVKECQEKQGTESPYLCQPQLYIKRKNDSSPANVTTSKTNLSFPKIETLLITTPAATLLAAAVGMLFTCVIFLVIWQWLCKKSSDSLTRSNFEVFVQPCDENVEAMPLQTQNRERTQGENVQVTQRDSEPNDCYTLQNDTDKTSRDKETDLFLKNNQENHFKKKKIKQNRRKCESDFDIVQNTDYRSILQNNPFYVLEHSKYTTM